MASRRQTPNTTSNRNRQNVRRESAESRQARREYQEAARAAKAHEQSRSRKTAADRKRREQKMRTRVTLISVLLILLVAGGAAFAMRSSLRNKDGEEAGATITAVTSREENSTKPEEEPGPDPHDADGDGIPNQQDIFESAMAYVATKPQYESRYYQEGYPTDGYGVCTDVIGFAFLGAGLDLQQLIKEDIENHREDYPEIETPDPKIDFRRVPNIRTYLERTAESLTTDPADTEAWQPGDIVTWPHHIGIISDQKNEKGIPLVIHHAGRSQTNYVEDILEGNSHYTYVKEITGHYRVK